MSAENKIITVGDVFAADEKFTGDRKLEQSLKRIVSRLRDERGELVGAYKSGDDSIHKTLEAIDVVNFIVTAANLPEVDVRPNGLTHEKLIDLQKGASVRVARLSEENLVRALDTNAKNAGLALQNGSFNTTHIDNVFMAAIDLATKNGIRADETFRVKLNRNCGEDGKYPVDAVLALTSGGPARIEHMIEIGQQWSGSDNNYINPKKIYL